jgi:hypothetical protein
VSSDEPDHAPAVDPYDDDLGELVVAYAEHLVMQGRFAALSTELERIRGELSIVNDELGAAGRAGAPIPAAQFTGKEHLLDQLISVSEASSAETHVYVTEMGPHLHMLLDRIHRRLHT